MKRRVNLYKIRSLVSLIIDIIVVVWVNTGVKKAKLFTWILFEIFVMMIPINIMFICRKKVK